MHNIKQVLEFSINLSKKKKKIHYPELNSQSFTENGAIIQLPNNVVYVDTIMHRKGKFSMDGHWGLNHIGKQGNEWRLWYCS